MEKITVFGASGFIGSKFCKMYPDNTIKMKRNQHEPETNNILNFISTTNNYAFRDSILADINSNVVVMLQILEKAKNKFGSDFTFNQISTWSVYGITPLPAVETATCNPTGFYSISKRTAEQLLITFCTLYGITYRIFRLCNIIGKNDRVTQTKNSLQYLIEELKMNKDITLYDNGDFLREFMYVDDVCRGIEMGLTLCDNYNEIYNLGTGKPSVYGDLILYCKEKLKSTSIITCIDSPIAQGSVQAKDIYLNVDKIKDIGFKPNYNVYEALDIIMGV